VIMLLDFHVFGKNEHFACIRLHYDSRSRILEVVLPW
jgi:hypothetical protein